LPEPAPSNHRPSIHLSFPGDFRTSGVPFVCTYATQTAPFDLTVTHVTLDTVPDPELHLDKLAVEYEDGTAVDLTARFAGRLKPAPVEHWYIDDDHVFQKKPALRASHTLPRCMPKRAAFVLRASTRLLSRGRVVETFDTARRYSYHS